MREPERPNIVLITSDHHRGDLLGSAGHPVVRTPHLDYLARAGMRFGSAYSSCPVCMPARYSIMTGKQPYRLGLTDLKDIPIPTRNTLPALLGRAGYQTRAVGKMHFWPQRAHYGFDSMVLCEEGRFLEGPGGRKSLDDYETWLAEMGYPGEAFSHGMANNESSMAPWHLPDHLHPTEWIGREACKAIKTRDWTRPLFMWVSFTAPHPPLTPLLRDLYLYEREEIPPPVMGDWVGRRSRFDEHSAHIHGAPFLRPQEAADSIRAFYALITQIDRQIFRILGTLREEGILDNTWIIYTADHGDMMGDHGLWAKRSFLEGSAGIPFIIFPGQSHGAPWMDSGGGPAGRAEGAQWQPGRVSNALVGLEDILPTCLDIAGIPVSEADPEGGLDGRSLLPVLRGEAESVRDTMYGEVGLEGRRTFMVCDGEWKYIWFEEDGVEYLFNLREDPKEMREVSGQHPAEAARLREALIAHLGKREHERAVEGGRLRPLLPEAKPLSAGEKAAAVWNFLPRGLH